MERLELMHGVLELPAFFPDATHGVVRTLDFADVAAAGIPGVVMNTFHLLTRPGLGVVRAMGGLHEMCGWRGPILTDSGGFQAYSMISQNPKFGQLRPNGILFKPENGGRIEFTPERCIQMQLSCGSDIVMALDACTHPDAPYEEQKRAVELTIKWGRQSREAFDRLSAQKYGKNGPRPKLFGIIQGGADPELRRECAQALISLGFEGFGYGGWPLDQENRLVLDTLALTASLMPDHLPKYAMGLGRPEEIVALHRLGYDLFDCVIPTREARHGRLYTFAKEEPDEQGDFYRFLYIVDEDYCTDSRPIEEGCDCHTCKNYSRAYLRHLFKAGDSAALRLATIHNLRFFSRLMEKLRAEDRA
ncbi:MAG: tRNA guanosine(34) transglycosylase Tgt [Eubacteriales bacterium]|nr:tRNA guanosine(34) transglycosylase Tgt [Eubacteriales bacterium]